MKAQSSACHAQARRMLFSSAYLLQQLSLHSQGLRQDLIVRRGSQVTRCSRQLRPLVFQAALMSACKESSYILFLTYNHLMFCILKTSVKKHNASIWLQLPMH